MQRQLNLADVYTHKFKLAGHISYFPPSPFLLSYLVSPFISSVLLLSFLYITPRLPLSNQQGHGFAICPSNGFGKSLAEKRNFVDFSVKMTGTEQQSLG